MVATNFFLSIGMSKESDLSLLDPADAFLDTLFNHPPPVIRNSRCLDQYAYRRHGGGDRDGDRACETI